MTDFSLGILSTDFRARLAHIQKLAVSNSVSFSGASKGTILAGDTDQTVAPTTAGTFSQVLQADPTANRGVRWVTPQYTRTLTTTPYSADANTDTPIAYFPLWGGVLDSLVANRSPSTLVATCSCNNTTDKSLVITLKDSAGVSLATITRDTGSPTSLQTLTATLGACTAASTHLVLYVRNGVNVSGNNTTLPILWGSLIQSSE